MSPISGCDIFSSWLASALISTEGTEHLADKLAILADVTTFVESLTAMRANNPIQFNKFSTARAINGDQSLNRHAAKLILKFHQQQRQYH